jgi:tetratricopeptide (TPR) repeat protein
VRGSWLHWAIGALLVAAYAMRAAVGFVGGPAFSIGWRLSTKGAYERALPLVERGAVGLTRGGSLWLAGQVRLGIWQARIAEGERVESLEPLLAAAYTDYTEAISLSPASGWAWASLGELYYQRERVERWASGLPLELLEYDRWAYVGQPGRVGVGLNRIAIEREPEVYRFHDQLAFMFLYYGLMEESLEAVRASAEALPVYEFHVYSNLDPVPSELLDAFGEAAREAVGHAPSLRPVLHRIGLGRFAVMRGQHEQAERDLRQALAMPAEKLNLAEANYHLGRALIGQGRYDEADNAFVESAKHRNFAELAVAGRAHAARLDGRAEDALALYREARRLNPRNPSYALIYARLATGLGEWERADEALRWAETIAPRDARLLEERIRWRIARGDLSGAETDLAALAALPGTADSVSHWRVELETARKQ